jgi:hypothetical protein
MISVDHWYYDICLLQFLHEWLSSVFLNSKGGSQGEFSEKNLLDLDIEFEITLFYINFLMTVVIFIVP